MEIFLAILELLLTIDKMIFIFINNNLSNPIFDFIMPIFDNSRSLIPIMLIPFIAAIIIDKHNRLKLILLIPLIIIIADQSGLFLKKTVLRPRPWAGLDSNLVIHLVSEKGKNYSFPSNHAANMSGLAVIFSSIYRKYNYIFWSIATTVMFSRIYIGVHYPSDVIAGLLIGLICGKLLINIFKYYKRT